MTSISYGDAVTDALDRLDDLGYERAGQADLASHGPMGAETLAVLGHGDAIPAWVDAYRAAMANHDRPSRRFDLDPADESARRSAPSTGSGTGSTCSTASWRKLHGARCWSGGGPGCCPA